MKLLFFIFVVLFISPGRADIICDTDVSSYSATYQANTYTCEPGYFLPANTLGCVACPTGFTCAGGTFSFNANEYQGLVLGNVTTNTMNNVCADNFPMQMTAVYEPNTITLNFNDGNGNTTTTTCEYGDTITIPDTVPTRTGYDFAGWQIVNTGD